MESRQLSYFILTCQHRSHAEAAASLGLSASALSENVNLLEKELGLQLFQRGPFGHYPTETARWLYQSVEPILQSLEAGEGIFQTEELLAVQRLEIMSPLRFLMGRVSRAASLAARMLRQTHPNVLATVRFAPTIGTYRDGETDNEVDNTKGEEDLSVGSQSIGKVLLDYDLDDGNATPLLYDPWICITSLDRMTENGQVVDFETIRRGPLFVPAMRAPQLRRLRDYCQKHDLPEPTIFDDDMGTFPKLSRMTESFCLMGPRTPLAGGLARLNLGYMRLPQPLRSALMAQVSGEHPAARRYISLLAEIIKDPEPVLLYQPRMTMKQVRYFLTLHDQLNMTTAARKLDVVQSALSSQLRKLEEVVGQKLFRRHSSGLQTTDYSERLKDLLAPALKQFDEVINKAPLHVAAQQHRLAIGIVPTADHANSMTNAITDALQEWARRHHDVTLQILEAPLQVLHRWVEVGKISLAIVETQASRASHAGLEGQDILGVVTSATAKRPLPKKLTLAQAAKLPLVLQADTGGIRQLLAQAAAEAHIGLTPQLEINSLTMTLGMVSRAGLATILPYHAVQPHIESGAFRFSPIFDPILRCHLSFLFSASRSLTENERNLAAILRRHLSLAGLMFH
jgi:DNA-binding transcriptional LysR family regulator